MCRFAKVGTSEKHLKQNLDWERNPLATQLETLPEQKGNFYTMSQPAQSLPSISPYPIISMARNGLLNM